MGLISPVSQLLGVYLSLIIRPRLEIPSLDDPADFRIVNLQCPEAIETLRVFLGLEERDQQGAGDGMDQDAENQSDGAKLKL